MSARMSTEEMLESLTGFEEIAIERAFSAEVMDLAKTKPTMFLRSLVFTHLVREGQDVNSAKQSAMELTLKASQGFFEEAEEELMPDDPSTEPGKDSAPLG